MPWRTNGGDEPASEQIVDAHREKFGEDYRVETEGPHPVEALRQQRA